MTIGSSLTLTKNLHERLRAHLFPGDGLEAAAIILCARAPGPRTRLLARDVIFVPIADCKNREPNRLNWPGAWLEVALERGESQNLTLLLVHSHPQGTLGFSEVDDQSDEEVVPCLFQAYGDIHGTAIMIPSGRMQARIYSPDMVRSDLDLVCVPGEDIKLWWSDDIEDQPRPTAFTSSMTKELNRLSVAVIGVSGTGSIVAEQAARLGFGRVILIDFDKVEIKNLNRILNSNMSHVANSVLKSHAFADAISTYRSAEVAVPVAKNIATRESVSAASQADIIFSCVDSLQARYIADLISAFFLVPLIDVGVVIPTRRTSTGFAIADAVGRIDYVYPGAPTLGDRQVYTPTTLREEYLRRTHKGAYEQELNAGYLQGEIEEAPSVISLNMRAAATAMNEFIARAYPFRLDENALFARTTFSLAACEEEYFKTDQFPIHRNESLGKGATEPLLDLPALSA